MTATSVNRAISWNVVSMKREQGGGGGATNGWQDKSREARPGRLAGKRVTISYLARCAATRDSLRLRANS